MFQGRGVGVYILKPLAAGISYAPLPHLLYAPLPQKGIFSVGGGCIKFGLPPPHVLLPASNSSDFRTEHILPNIPIQGLCVSTEEGSHVLAKCPVGMTDLKIKRILRVQPSEVVQEPLSLKPRILSNTKVNLDDDNDKTLRA